VRELKNEVVAIEYEKHKRRIDFLENATLAYGSNVRFCAKTVTDLTETFTAIPDMLQQAFVRFQDRLEHSHFKDIDKRIQALRSYVDEAIVHRESDVDSASGYFSGNGDAESGDVSGYADVYSDRKRKHVSEDVSSSGSVTGDGISEPGDASGSASGYNDGKTDIDMTNNANSVGGAIGAGSSGQLDSVCLGTSIASDLGDIT